MLQLLKIEYIYSLKWLLTKKLLKTEKNVQVCLDFAQDSKVPLPVELPEYR